MGIEPTLFAWEARVLPLNDARNSNDSTVSKRYNHKRLNF
jgi:hypothetical protein